MNENEHMKVIVIGAGPAGLMAARSIDKSHHVILLDSQKQVGSKLLLTGNGRCNVTNNKEPQHLLRHLNKSSKFLHSALNSFPPSQIIEFFASRGCPLVEEKNNQMWPKSNRASSIVKALKDENIETHLETKVLDWIIKDHKVIGINTNRGKYYGDHFIVATGGKSFPVTGSDGSGYKLAKKLGHTVTKLLPAEVALVAQVPQELQGISLENIPISVFSDQKKKPIANTEDDLIFTHFGFSGPGILRISESCVTAIDKGFEVKIQFELNEVPLEKGLIKTTLKGWMPKRYVDTVLKDIVDIEKTLEQWSKQQLLDLRQQLFRPTFTIMKPREIEKAFVTMGGIKTSELVPATMKSKLHPNVSFCGEILDCHGEVGGYNITIALCSGYAAGKGVDQN